ncbi:MAG: hypothetical protein WC568_05960 [Candidatus Methanoperedens sp.]
MKLLSCEKAEAELVGHIIILGITVLGISMIALYGVPAIYSLEDMANVKNVEQAFAILDSRASRAILGDSPLQITSINLGGGSLTVEPNSSTSKSYIVVNSDIFNFTIPMGKVKYQLGDRIVAYEGGGVWSKYPSGGSVMLSRPEFNFNGVTLTLPVFNISGSTSVGGRGTAAVSFKKPAMQVLFPNTSNAGWAGRTNPVNYTQVGKVNVTIKSDFYDAWANHIETAVKSAKVVYSDPKNFTTRIELTVYPAYIGKSDSEIKDPIAFRGLDPSNSTPLNNFSFRVVPSNNPFDWDLRAISGTGNRRLIFHIKDGKSPDDKVSLYVGYWENNDSYTETWDGQDLFTIQDGNPDYVDIDLLNKSVNLTYNNENVGSDNSASCKSFGVKIAGITDPDFSWDDRIINLNDKQSLYNITQHYIQKLAQEGDFSFEQCSNHGPESGSTMDIDYFAPGGLTYLHITDNKADVGIS